jgi:nitrosocyanin
MRKLVIVLAMTLALGAPLARAGKAPAPTAALTVVNVEYEGTKIWLPGTLVVKKGTKVTLTLINNVPPDASQHGFAIPAYKIEELVTKGEPKTVEFTADKAGVFEIHCQLHPKHVGGQLVVLP